MNPFCAALLCLATSRGDAKDEWTLFRNLAQHRGIEVVADDASVRAAAELAVARGGSEGALGHAFRIVSSAEASSSGPRIVLGTLKEPWVLELATRAGFAGESAAGATVLKVQGMSFAREDELVVATCADPERAGLPLTLFLAYDSVELASSVHRIAPFSRPGAIVRRRDALILELPFQNDGSAEWGKLVDYQTRRGEPQAQVTHEHGDVALRYPQGLDATRVEDYADVLVAARKALQRKLGGTPSGRFEVRVLPSLAELYARRGAEALAHASSTTPGEGVALLAERLPHDGGGAAARALAYDLLGPPSEEWLSDGVGAAFAETWWGRRKPEWLAILVEADLVPPIAELVAPDAARRISPHVLVPLRGALFSELFTLKGRDFVVDLWQGRVTLAVEAELEQGFRDALHALHAVIAPRLAEERERRSSTPLASGVCLVPGGDPEEGFLHEGLRQSLIQAREAGAGAVVLLPTAYLEPRPLPFAGLAARPWPDASPGDLALASAVVEARALGLQVLLAPQILATPGGTWADALALGGQAGIGAFFAGYGDVLTHYALLAELLGVDVLCLGSERGLVSTTLADGEEDEKSRDRYALLLEHWKALIASTRRIFRGQLTYAAEAHSELPRVAFWPALDFVGVTLFPSVGLPRGQYGRASAKERLAEWLSDSAAVAGAAGRPLLVLQTGFPSHHAAHSAPLLARGTVDLELQADLYRLLGEVFAEARAAGEVAAVFLWRWDPDPNAGGTSDASHTPQGKPAAALLGGFFGE
jgi:hypothetical protein